MLQAMFHAWERRLAERATDRIVRPFDWGLDWIPPNGDGEAAARAPFDVVSQWVDRVMDDTDRFFSAPPTSQYRLHEPSADGERLLTFPSVLETPHAENNTVYARLFPAPRRRQGARAAVVVLPQWNSDRTGHVGLCRLLAFSGMTALRVALPYHDQRMPPELHRADYIVSANVTRTVQVCRQAVLDARRAVAWLAGEGFERIGILGTSLGSCLALLTTAHEPLIRAQALNHVSPFFADVVWRGLSTRHVREGLDGHIDLPQLRTLWQPITPARYLNRLGGKRTLLVYARYDLTFPVDLSEHLVEQFRALHLPHEVAVLRCGHYSTGKAPFKFADGWILTRFLRRELCRRFDNRLSTIDRPADGSTA